MRKAGALSILLARAELSLQTMLQDPAPRLRPRPDGTGGSYHWALCFQPDPSTGPLEPRIPGHPCSSCMLEQSDGKHSDCTGLRQLHVPLRTRIHSKTWPPLGQPTSSPPTVQIPSLPAQPRYCPWAGPAWQLLVQDSRGGTQTPFCMWCSFPQPSRRLHTTDSSAQRAPHAGCHSPSKSP